MMKLLNVSALKALLVAGLFALASIPASAAGNLIQNGDFSAGSTSWTDVGAVDDDATDFSTLGKAVMKSGISAAKTFNTEITQALHIAAGTYDFGVSFIVNALPQAKGFPTISMSITNLAGDVFFAGFAQIINSNFIIGVGQGGVQFAEGDYLVHVAGTGKGYTLGLTNVNLAATAVPGPIAGAGFPALLGLAGVVLYRRRRTALAA